MVEVDDLPDTFTRAVAFGSVVSEVLTDKTPEGRLFREATVTSPGGHTVLVYEIGDVARAMTDQEE